jgi:hypothetical protein
MIFVFAIQPDPKFDHDPNRNLCLSKVNVLNCLTVLTTLANLIIQPPHLESAHIQQTSR